MYKNHEGYPDPTAGQAVHEADRPPEDVREVIRLMRNFAHLTGYEIVGRITLKDIETGKMWR